METPQLPGKRSNSTSTSLSSLIKLAVVFKHLHAVWRSGVLVAAALRDWTPVQHARGIAPPVPQSHLARSKLTCNGGFCIRVILQKAIRNVVHIEIMNDRNHCQCMWNAIPG
ncbi:hypothetical protein FRX31_008232 [Thalictrum thalictroides]|uniref:Uncharacterized protein n=1 Tax=Thalictrum thalictroides TaxID=46969 RepID=A0A7J6X025_THATH|nr:hypothetical protein FRX31_008232 [Thalictrum thalictroides]